MTDSERIDDFIRQGARESLLAMRAQMNMPSHAEARREILMGLRNFNATCEGIIPKLKTPIPLGRLVALNPKLLK